MLLTAVDYMLTVERLREADSIAYYGSWLGRLLFGVKET